MNRNSQIEVAVPSGSQPHKVLDSFFLDRASIFLNQKKIKLQMEFGNDSIGICSPQLPSSSRVKC